MSNLRAILSSATGLHIASRCDPSFCNRSDLSITSLVLLYAQERPAVPRKTVTLEEALALAERHNPQLRAASAAIEGAEAGIVTASAYPESDDHVSEASGGSRR